MARWSSVDWKGALLTCVLICGLCATGGTAWAKQGVAIPLSLRQDLPINVLTSLDRETVDTAVAMQNDGWRYMMPMPKNNQASWNNYDGGATWWVGYWQNAMRGTFSLSTPVLDPDTGHYVGDDQGGHAWRRGGAPDYPTDLEWLLSSGGGPK